MTTSTITVDGEKFWDTGGLSDEDIDEIKLEVAREMDADIRREAARLPGRVDVDDQINWNFGRSWRKRKRLGKRDSLGSDYGYWNAVLYDAVDLFQRYGRGRWDPWTWSPKDGTRTPRRKALARFEEAYSLEWDIWQNGTPVSLGQPLEGPVVDFGPNVDNALFKDAWDTGDLPNIRVFRGQGVIHAIAFELQKSWRGVHTIYPMAISPRNRGRIIGKLGREEFVRLMPIIRITSRHYRVGVL